MVASSDTLSPSIPARSFAYGTACVGDLRLRSSSRSPAGRLRVEELEIDGRPVKPTPRFWRSFFSRFGLSDNVFRYFEPDEVFERVWDKLSDREEGARFRYCVEATDGDVPDTLLGVTSTGRPVIPYDAIAGLVQRYGATDVQYRDGLLTSTHHPRARGREQAIGGDAFRDSFILETPIDGYGHPRLFLSLLRLVCTNGMIGYTRAFRSDIPTGKDLDHCIARAIVSFDSQDGYSALRQRFESAQTSFASVRESLNLVHLLERLDQQKQLKQEGLVQRLRVVSGNLTELYGLANLDALSEKRRRVLPAKCRVYDLLNYASEVATHHAEADGAWQLQAYLGKLISDEYDLEGTADGSSDFDAFFLPSAEAVA
jgi:hypothetical protein